MRPSIVAFFCLIFGFTGAAITWDEPEEIVEDDERYDDCYEEEHYDDFVLSSNFRRLGKGKKVRVLSCAKVQRKVAEQRALEHPFAPQEKAMRKVRKDHRERVYFLQDHRKNKAKRSDNLAVSNTQPGLSLKTSQPKKRSKKLKILTPVLFFVDDGKCQIYLVRLKNKQGCGLQCLGSSRSVPPFVRIAPGTLKESFNR